MAEDFQGEEKAYWRLKWKSFRVSEGLPKEPSPDSQMAWFLHHSTDPRHHNCDKLQLLTCVVACGWGFNHQGELKEQVTENPTQTGLSN